MDVACPPHLGSSMVCLRLWRETANRIFSCISFSPALSRAIVVIAALGGANATRAQDAGFKLLETCLAIQEEAARLRCFEQETANLASSPKPVTVPANMHAWRLVRTPRPAGGKDAVSITHTADVQHSDPELAGLIIRCGKAGNEVVVALISPLPPRPHPKVVLGGFDIGRQLEAKVVTPGAMVLLPAEAAKLASGPWQSMNELPIEIRGEEAVIRGIIPLVGLAAALQALAASCPAD